MNPEITKQLERILDKRQQKKQAAEDLVSQQQRAEAKNLADFKVKKSDVILPAFKEIVELYNRRGFQIQIVDEEERLNDRGGFPVPNVRLDMTALYALKTEMKSQFRLSFEKRDRQVSLYTATSSQSGPAGSVELDNLTADWIHGEFVKYQSKSF